MKRQVPLTLVFVFGLFMIVQFFIPHESSEWVYEYLLDWILIIGIFAVALAIWSLFTVAVNKVRTRKENWEYSIFSLIGLFSMILFGITAPNEGGWSNWYYIFILAVLLSIGGMVQAMSVKSGRGLWAGLMGVFGGVAVLIAMLDDTWRFAVTSGDSTQNPMFQTWFEFILIPILATTFSLLAFFIASAAYRAFRARNVLATLLLVAALIVMLRFNPYLVPIFGDNVSRLSNWLMNVPNLAAQRAIVMGVGLGIVATALKVILGIERGYMGKG